MSTWHFCFGLSIPPGPPPKKSLKMVSALIFDLNEQPLVSDFDMNYKESVFQSVILLWKMIFNFQNHLNQCFKKVKISTWHFVTPSSQESHELFEWSLFAIWILEMGHKIWQNSESRLIWSLCDGLRVITFIKCEL